MASNENDKARSLMKEKCWNFNDPKDRTEWLKLTLELLGLTEDNFPFSGAIDVIVPDTWRPPEDLTSEQLHKVFGTIEYLLKQKRAVKSASAGE